MKVCNFNFDSKSVSLESDVFGSLITYISNDCNYKFEQDDKNVFFDYKDDHLKLDLSIKENSIDNNELKDSIKNNFINILNFFRQQNNVHFICANNRDIVEKILHVKSFLIQNNVPICGYIDMNEIDIRPELYQEMISEFEKIANRLGVSFELVSSDTESLDVSVDKTYRLIIYPAIVKGELYFENESVLSYIVLDNSKLDEEKYKTGEGYGVYEFDSIYQLYVGKEKEIRMNEEGSNNAE